jgi:pimeloyl-ACP methyl ester carboxylesterase
MPMISIRSRHLAANGISFALDEAGEGDDVALLLHGCPEARAAWRHQLASLADLGWHAVAPDLRGYGETSRPDAKDAYRLEHLIDDVAALFEGLGARRKVLIGHDWGGVIAWQVAIRQRVALDGLVILNAPHPAVFDRVLKRGWRQKLRSWYILLFLLPWLPEKVLTSNDGRNLVRGLSRQMRVPAPDLLEIYRHNVVQRGAATAMLNYYRANALSLGADGGADGKIATPTLMIWGDDDLYLDVALTQDNEDFVKDFTLKRLPKVSHWVQQDASDEVNLLIAEWASAKGLTHTGA